MNSCNLVSISAISHMNSKIDRSCELIERQKHASIFLKSPVMRKFTYVTCIIKWSSVVYAGTINLKSEPH